MKNEGKKGQFGQIMVLKLQKKKTNNHLQANGTCWEIGGFGLGKIYVELREKLPTNHQISVKMSLKSL